MDGILLVNKPAGITSAAAVRRIKAKVKSSRGGHLGTLDPLATGVLPIMVGEATKLALFLEGGDKEYQGVIKLGAETDTLDRDGTVVRTAEIPVLSAAHLEEIAAMFSGSMKQTPPLFSAIKRRGTPLYRLARRGVQVEAPAARQVEIKRLELEAKPPDSIHFTVVCSSGTYVRSLARDIGLALKSAGHLSELCRIRNGSFELKDTVALDEVTARLERGEAGGLIGLRQALPCMPEVLIDASFARRLRDGDARVLDGRVPLGATLFKAVSPSGDLVAIAKRSSPTAATIERVFRPVA